MKAYVTIGNSDKKLTRADWEDFYQETFDLMDNMGTIISVWRNDGTYVNACFLYEVPEDVEAFLRGGLAKLAGKFNQDSIGLAWTESELIQPAR